MKGFSPGFAFQQKKVSINVLALGCLLPQREKVNLRIRDYHEQVLNCPARPSKTPQLFFNVGAS